LEEILELDDGGKSVLSFELDRWSEERVDLEKSKRELGRRTVIRESERAARQTQIAGTRPTSSKVKEELGKCPSG